MSLAARQRALLVAIAIVGVLAAVAFARKPTAAQASGEHDVEKASESDEYGSSSSGLMYFLELSLTSPYGFNRASLYCKQMDLQSFMVEEQSVAPQQRLR